MNHFYVCDACGSAYETDVLKHISSNGLGIECDGKIKPAFYADDLLKEIEERIKKNLLPFQDDKHDAITDELQSLADAIKGN